MDRLAPACLHLGHLLDRDEAGQDLAEYMLLVALLAVAVIGAISLLGGGVQSFLIHTLLVIERATGTTPGVLG